MMKTAAALAAVALLLGRNVAAPAGPPTLEESRRQAQALEQLKKSLDEEATAAGKLAVLTRLMKNEPAVEVRRAALDLGTTLPAPELDTFLTGVLGGDEDAGIRSQAATLLGRHGSEKCLPALARAAATDRTTAIDVGCFRGQSSARRAATFAIADLVARFPRLADDAAGWLRALEPADEPRGEGLADARIQALYQVTGDKELLKPFYERLRSRDAKVRAEGVVAFRFLKLKAAPPELIAALKDDDAEVRSWAVLVVGEIEGPAKRPQR
jgi:HEAT repeat protein